MFENISYHVNRQIHNLLLLPILMDIFQVDLCEPILDYTGAKMMEVVVTTGALRRAKLQSNCHHQQTNTQLVLQVGCPSCCPTDSVRVI